MLIGRMLGLHNLLQFTHCALGDTLIGPNFQTTRSFIAFDRISCSLFHLFNCTLHLKPSLFYINSTKQMHCYVQVSFNAFSRKQNTKEPRETVAFSLEFEMSYESANKFARRPSVRRINSRQTDRNSLNPASPVVRVRFPTSEHSRTHAHNQRDLSIREGFKLLFPYN